ncbi:MAG: efflux RND transporter permease subunit [Rhodocyclaceae bacterium]|nr:efflux RND transporter permease subunit [Rhodocyclaceae bacterium]
MNGPNLSEWAISHRPMVLFLILISMIGGISAYQTLGRAEDPEFTFKAMVVRTVWPGASAEVMAEQVSERVEKKLMEVQWADFVRSYSKPGESVVTFFIKDSASRADIHEAYKQARKKMDEVKPLLPEGTIGPFANDEFGSVQVKIWALTGDGFDLAELRRQAEAISRDLRLVKDVRKIELIGVQDERIYVDVIPARLAKLGLLPEQVFDAVQRRNAIAPAGLVETATDRVRIQVSGEFTSAEALRDVQFAIGGRYFHLGDVATVTRGLVEPPQPRMRFKGKDAIGIGVVMAQGGNVLELGRSLDVAMAKHVRDLPIGIDVHTVANQPEIVKTSFELFINSLGEAIIIVLAVSFLSLGMRTGAVVALSIPLVLAITFLGMQFFKIDLHRISLGALIIALGLLVDDAIIAVEMMVVKMEQGWDRAKAATFAYTSTAFPMLTGTLITVAGFSPVGFAQSSSGEYTGAIFWVVSIALVVSWIVAVVFTPYIGYMLLDPKKLAAHAATTGGDPYATPFYRRLRNLVKWCLHHRWLVIFATVALFVLSLVAFQTVVQKQFFPPASRPELLVDIALNQGASSKATDREIRRVEAMLEGDERVVSYSAIIGSGVPRFFLSLDLQLPNVHFGQVMIIAKDNVARESLAKSLREAFRADDGSWSHVRTRVASLENGPPVGYPVQYRVSGTDIAALREQAQKISAELTKHPNLRDVNYDWFDKVKSVRVEIDQARARALGVNSQDVALTLQAWLVGAAFTQYREGDQLIDVVWRGDATEGRSLDRLPDLDILTSTGRHVPLAQVATLKPVLEEGVIWRRNRLPTITVRADIVDMQPAVAVKQLAPKIDALRDQLPAGFHIEEGGSVNESAKGEQSIQAVMPYALTLVVLLLMMQLQSLGRTVLVLLTAPLGLIGVAFALIVFHFPFGFVANLGVIALMGMILRNSVILVDQIDQDEKAGKSSWDAIIDSTVRRFRPIVLTAMAAILSMIPLVRQDFWGPMAGAIMGGLLGATLLTCLFLPALYAAWYRVKPDATV